MVRVVHGCTRHIKSGGGGGGGGGRGGDSGGPDTCHYCWPLKIDLIVVCAYTTHAHSGSWWFHHMVVRAVVC